MRQLPAEYLALKRGALTGFHPYQVRSVLSHVDMETGYALNVALKEAANGHYLKEALIGRFGQNEETVTPEAYARNGRYTSVKVEFEGVKFRVESCRDDAHPLLLLVTPLSQPLKAPLLVLESGFLWNRPGVMGREKNTLIAVAGQKRYTVYMTQPHAALDKNLPVQAPYLAAEFTQEIAFSVNEMLEVEQVRRLMAGAREDYAQELAQYGDCRAEYEAMQLALNWDTTYDAKNDRLISPVSRLWSINNGGYVLFCWDNYFAGFMASLSDPAVSYSNLIEITLERTKNGFVPNFIHGTGLKSEDRSQPPVGSAMVLETYRRTKEKWLIAFLYPYLFDWNTWWTHNRMEDNGTLCWGSNPVRPEYGNQWEVDGVHGRFGAALESGMDNSPAYDDIPFDESKNRLKLMDVGLTGLYLLDCRSLIQLAKALGKQDDVETLTKRLAHTQEGLETLWDEEAGFYCNRRTDTLEFSHRYTPMNFFALFSDAIPSPRIKRILQHYYDPNEFYGDWMLPSVARCDAAYPQQDYWRGRVWAPLNFLTYMAFLQHPLADEARRSLAEKSRALLLNEWEKNRHVHENYNAITGEGCDVPNSDKFYHWGALLGVISMIEKGVFPHFGAPL